MAKKKSGLSNRYNKSYETRDSGGGSQALDWKQVGREIKFFTAKEGKNRINIIPYTISSKNHPLVKSGDMEIGDLDYVMDIWLHKNVGPGQAAVVCLKKNYAKACPICEKAEEFKKKGKQKEYEELKPSRRAYYNIQDIKNPDTIQVFDVSQYLFEKELIEEARTCSDDGDMVDFADPETGKTVIFRASTASFGGHDYLEYKSFQFNDREDEIEEEIIEAAVPFDALLKVLSYEDIEKILYGQDDEDDSDDEKPAKKNKAKDDDDDEPEKKPAKKKSADDDDDEPTPPKNKKKNTEEDDAPAEKKADKKKDAEDDKPAGPKCPNKHTFGTDCDDFEECNDCDLWDKCVKAQKAAKK